MDGNDFLKAHACAAADVEKDSGRGGTPEELKALGARYLEKHEFELGQLVTWKEGMKTCKFPDYGKPAVVIEMADIRSGLGDDGHISGNHDYEPNHIRIGVVLKGGGEDSFEAYWVDANRFKPYE